MQTGVRRGPVDVGALVCGLVVTGLGILLLLDFVDVIELDFGILWPVMLAVGGALLLALGLTGPRPPRGDHAPGHGPSRAPGGGARTRSPTTAAAVAPASRQRPRAARRRLLGD